ncbi:MAG TPA: thiamine-phosphate kinase [Desulfobacteraceae bacterium]|nr:thiamine-phosphate kinase [Desulfobacteraceae bacterium]HPJ68383.1 thiamine-phosphate kinase [Desulfobacteraceae bacterium]HPQ27741.1 thiamine-phosphate kinase [Desulfobacteraceae bacterium]
MTETVADTGEFKLIDRIHAILRNEGVMATSVKVGIGDDCASFSPRKGYEMLVTCDCVVEGKHFLPRYFSPVELGQRTMTLNISDIGAMGGKPLYALVSLGLKRDTPVSFVEALYRGFLYELNPFGASIIGGNLTESGGGIFIDVTLIGEVKQGRIVRRSGSRAGDAILVTGFPGESAAGLKLLQLSIPDKDFDRHHLVTAYKNPSHRACEGHAIAESGCATAMIDISDGIIGDLGHICRESRVGARLFKQNIPISEHMHKAASYLGEDPYEMFMKSSDDYELIITCPPDCIDRIRAAVASAGNVPVTELGIITDENEGINLISPDGSQRRIKPSGWDHFSRHLKIS